MTKLAFENPTGDVFQLSEKLIEKGLKASKESPRKRMILPLHRRQDAEVQRLINFMQPETYVRPHKHPLAHATESIVMLKGSLRFFTFDAAGNVDSDQILKAAPVPGVMDIEPDVWHSLLVLETDTILFECKKGPYNAETDKIFADWSPEEGDGDVKNWIEKLK